MSHPTRPFAGPNALVISVDRENSLDHKNWYSVNDWTAHPCDFSSLPAAIQEGFHTLAEEGTVGAVARGQHDTGADIVLYLLNISAMQAIKPAAGGQGEPIHNFTTSLAHQTILLRGSEQGGTEIHCCQLVQADWSAHPHAPSDWKDGSPSVVDGLIKDSNLALDVEPDLHADVPLIITCYLLNLASFTDPPLQSR